MNDRWARCLMGLPLLIGLALSVIGLKHLVNGYNTSFTALLVMGLVLSTISFRYLVFGVKDENTK